MDHNSLEILALYHKARECYGQPEAEKHEEALQFLTEAAEKGMSEACKLLGLVYMSGQYAPWPEKNEETAVQWWHKAAEAGDEEAMYWMGQCCQDGIGTQADAQQARKWMDMAAAHGFVAEEEQPAADLPAEPEKDEAAARAEENLPQPKPEETEKAERAKPRKEKRKKRVENSAEEEAEAARYAREEEEARRIRSTYRMRMGLGGMISCLLPAVLIVIAVYWVANQALQEYEIIFWAGAAVLGVAAAAAGYAVGLKKAARKVEAVAEYRKTPFYHAFGCELGRMDTQQQWCYQVYQALAKNYLPVTYRKKLDLPELREYRGCLYPHWIYQVGKEAAQPEFVVLTEKAVYVIHTRCYTGRIQGDLRDTAWALYSDGAKDLTAEKIPNMVDENRRNMGILKAELSRCCELPLEQIPFYNVIFLNPEVDIKGLRRVSAEDDTMFVQGSPDKLRGSMGLWESRLSTHNMGMEDLTAAFAQIGKQFLKRSGW